MKVQARNPQAQQHVGRLYRRLGPVIYSRARRILKDVAEAEDATQEVFLRVMKHWDSMPDDDAKLAWVLRICTNYCLNVLRNRKSHARELVPEQESNESPERQMTNRNFAERALALTPPKIAATARLYYVDGLEQERVAQALAVTRRTVCNHLEAFLDQARALKAREEAAVLNPRRRSTTREMAIAIFEK